MFTVEEKREGIQELFHVCLRQLACNQIAISKGLNCQSKLVAKTIARDMAIETLNGLYKMGK